MLWKIAGVGVVVALVSTGAGKGSAAAGLKKLRTGATIGELKSVSLAKNKRDTEIEVLSPGEDKPRRYTVGQMQKDVLATLKEAKVGDRVEVEWFDTVEGLCVDWLRVLAKSKKATE